jgi:carbon monoxide dehydrogenase subunit G
MTTSIQSSIVINRPIANVFAVLTDVEKAGTWFPGNVKEWWTSAPPHGVGSIRRARVKMGWFTTENDAVVTIYEPPQRAGLKGMSKNAPFEAEFTFEPVDGGTLLNYNIELDMRGPAKPLEGVFMRWYGGMWERGLVNLKRMMEDGEL